MSLPNSSDAAFYGLNDNTANRAPTNSPDLTNQVRLDGTRAATPNTSGRYLNQVGITDSSSTGNGKPTDCDYISTKFNAHKDATYEVTIRDGKIYINTGNGDQLTQPQAHHPANIAEQQARDNNYYNNAAPPPVESLPPQGQYAQYPPPGEGFYPPPIMPMPFMPHREHWGYPHREPWGYPQREPWGYEHHRGGINPVGAVFGALFGGISALAGGRNYYPPEGTGYYRPAPVGYAPIQQASYNYGGNDGGGYYASNFTPRYTPGYSPGYTPASSYDAYANNNQQNDDSFYFS